jgi:hypothetical protein
LEEEIHKRIREFSTYNVHECVVRVVDYCALCDEYKKAKNKRYHRKDPKSGDILGVVGLWLQGHLVQDRQLFGIFKIFCQVFLIIVDRLLYQ